MLENVRVLDLTRVLAGPLCTMILGDLGAQVIKVERPGDGDETRAWGPPFDDRGESAYYLSINRNKIGVALDLDAEHDCVLLRDLARSADVVIDNYRPGTLQRRGIDPMAMLREHDRLIWCTITGFGPTAARPGYDFVVQAESGWMSITGEPTGAPMKVGVALADVIAGKDASIAVLAALAGRATPRPPGARRHFISLKASATAALVNVAQNVLVGGGDAGRWANAHPNLVPYQLFDASDRPFVLAAGNDSHWRSALAALELPELDLEELRSNRGRLAHRDRIVSAIAERVRQRPAAEWIARLDARGVPCGVVRTVAEALAGTGASALTGVPSAVGGTVRFPPPMHDEHGALVREFGWDAFAHVPTFAAEGLDRGVRVGY